MTFLNKIIKRKPLFWALGSVLFIIGCYGYFQRANLTAHFNFVLGIILLPIMVYRTGARSQHLTTLMVVLLAVIPFWVLSSSLYFFLTAFGILWILQAYFGQLSRLIWLWILIISPLFFQFVQLWSFPLRLKLSVFAAQVLRQIGESHAEGNTIYFNQIPFEVDPACAGLQMLVTALLVALVILAYFEQKSHREWSLLFTGFALAWMTVLTIAANIVRILTLILFRLPANHWSHDLAGLVGLLCYAILPFYYSIQIISRRQSDEHPENASGSIKGSLSRFSALGAVLLVLVVALHGWSLEQRDISALEDVPFCIDGYTDRSVQAEVIQLSRPDIMIYLKQPVGALRGSHDPRYCWQGSGYMLQDTRLLCIDGRTFYQAILEKDGTQLHTAWWFDNALQQTVAEWEWRWNTLIGEPGFYLISFTSSSEQELKRAIKEWMEANP